MNPTTILTAATLTGYPRALAAQQLEISVPRLMQLANQLIDEPTMADDPRVAKMRTARDMTRARRQAAGRL